MSQTNLLSCPSSATSPGYSVKEGGARGLRCPSVIILLYKRVPSFVCEPHWVLEGRQSQPWRRVFGFHSPRFLWSAWRVTEAIRCCVGSVCLLLQTRLCLRPTPLPGLLLSVSLLKHVPRFLQAQIKVHLFLRTLPHERRRCPVSTIWMRNWSQRGQMTNRKS